MRRGLRSSRAPGREARPRRLALAIPLRGAAALAIVLQLACASHRPAPPPRPEVGTAAPPAAAIRDLELLGEATLAPGLTFEETAVGGLSDLAYDGERDRYYAVSDDPSYRSPARFYTLAIDLAAGSLAPDGVSVEAVTRLTDRSGRPFPRLVMDAESIALTARRTLLISSEGNIREGVAPSLREFRLDGRELRRLRIPARYLPRGSRPFGVRHNLAFEALARAASGDGFYLGCENALQQDGPAADVGQASPARILRYAGPGRVAAEHVYLVEPLADPPATPEGFRTNGLVELLAVADDELLALERSFTLGVGNSVRLYAVSTRGATDVRRYKRLDRGRGAAYTPVAKRLLLDLTTLGLELDNLEGLTFGPRLPDGRRSLVLISDDNFSAAQRTQVLAFAVSEGTGGELRTTDP